MPLNLQAKWNVLYNMKTWGEWQMRGKVCYLFCRSTMRYDMEKIGRYEGKNKKFSFSPLISRFNFIHCCDLWAEQWMTCYTRNHLLSWRNERRSIHVRLLRVSWAMRGQNWSTDRKDVLKIVKSTKKWVFLKKIVGRQIFYRLRHRIFIINYICLLVRKISICQYFTKFAVGIENLI